MKCVSGRHFWLNPRHAEYCCCGYHQELRVSGDYQGAVVGAPVVHVAGEALMYVWVLDCSPPVAGEERNKRCASANK